MSERRERSFLRRAREERDEDANGPLEEPRRDPPDYEASPPPERPEASESSAGGYRRGSELRRSMAVAAERIDHIITSAYEMADAIRRDAELEAERYLELRRREADLVLEERLSALRRTLGAARLELDEIERGAMGEVGRPRPSEPRAPATPSAAPQSEPARPEPVPAPSAYPGRASDARSESRSDSRWGDERAAALIRASQLAIQGEPRDAIESVLRSDFGLEDPGEIVDQILPRRR